ncbi:Degenerin del-1 [Nymphon striatum]|nr:Degenerin del-1 [Nymphon striatum]
MQQREADMDVFFKHENNPTPPALSDGGKLRSGTKSDLMNCLVDTVAEPPTLFDVKVLDGAAVVHMLSVNAVGTFIEYANSVFLPHVVKQLENCQRIDVVWDTYLPNSIKESTREKRGKGVRRKVLGNNKIPGNWNSFLCDPTNKQELFSFLSDIIATAELPSGKVVAITCGEKVEMNGGVHLMETCDHEEADTRILIHLQDALQHGATTCLVRTVDTDVIVILIGKFYYLLTICPSAEIWVAFGTGKDFRYININAVAQALGIEMSTSLPIFHSFTGCDTVSSFYGRGKKTAWQAWKAYKEVTEAFVYIASNPFEMLDVTSRHFEQLERYCIILYDKTSSLTSMNDTRKELFCKRNKTMENLPPTQDALINHTKRALYQAGIWTSSQKPMQHVPSPADWGWTMDADGNRWVPVWRTLDVASKACKELVVNDMTNTLLAIRVTLTLLALTGLVYSFYLLAYEFIYDNVSVKYNLKTKHSALFPAVTVCNLNALVCSHIIKEEKLKFLLPSGICPSKSAQLQEPQSQPQPEGDDGSSSNQIISADDDGPTSILDQPQSIHPSNSNQQTSAGDVPTLIPEQPSENDVPTLIPEQPSENDGSNSNQQPPQGSSEPSLISQQPSVKDATTSNQQQPPGDNGPPQNLKPQIRSKRQFKEPMPKRGDLKESMEKRYGDVAPGNFNDPFYRRMAYLYTVMSLNGSERTNLGHDFENLIPSCTYMMDSCTKSDFLHTLDKDYGNCYTFNSAWEFSGGAYKLHSKRLKSTSQAGPSIGKHLSVLVLVLLYILQTIPNNFNYFYQLYYILPGLELAFNIEVMDYVPGMAHSSGITISVHDPFELPRTIYSQGKSFPTGQETNIAIKALYRYPQISEKEMYHQQNCPIMESLVQLHTIMGYTCIELSMQKALVEDAGCRDPVFSGYEAFPNASKCKDTHQNDEHYDIANKKFDRLASSCLEPCKEIMEQYNITDSDDFGQNFGKLKIYFDTLEETQINEVRRFTEQTLVSNFGGLAGLYIGVSFLSIYNLIEILLNKKRNEVKQEQEETHAAEKGNWSEKEEKSENPGVPKKYNLYYPNSNEPMQVILYQ